MSVAEREILYALASEAGEPSIWTIDELGREVESLADAGLAVRGLHSAGLVHRTSDGYVFATQAALHVVQMVGHVI
ncbi:MAG TPA: hypothetical protein VMD79_12555 [Solirubrobacteraceae bacterium]|nr:hypothetical protein [Solirubrobacteraceae bacterium]